MTSAEEVLVRQRAYAKERFVPIALPEVADELSKMVSALRPKRILEIGTAIGYSGLRMLLASPQSTLVTVDIDRERLEKAETFFQEAGVYSRVKIIEEDALYLLTLLEGEFDFVFLDGPKAHLAEMLPYILRLLSPSGVIFVDDVGYLGLVESGEYPIHKHRTIVQNMRAFLASVQEDPRLQTEKMDIGQGVLIIRKCQNPNC